MKDTVKCPNCGTMIQLDAVISSQIEESIRDEFNKKYIIERNRLKEKLQKDAELKFILDIKDKDKQLEEQNLKLKEFTEIKLALNQKERQISELNSKIQDEARKLFEEQRAKLANELNAELENKYKLKESDSQSQIEKLRTEIQNANLKELELLRQKRELEEKTKNVELEVERKLNEQLQTVRDETSKKFFEEHQLKEAQKDKIIDDLKQQIDSLQHKAELGSQQAQGEIQEIVLEEILRQKFPIDDIAPVPKGVRGADIIQSVRSKSNLHCGTIIWESKRTKNWVSDWIEKLKEDQLTTKATIAVIVTATLPKEINRLGQINKVWVCDFPTAPGLATALRSGMIDTAHTRLAMEGKNEKIELLYNYFAGQEFRDKIENIINTFNAMKDDLFKEKTSIQALWSKREKQIEKVLSSTSALYGDMRGILDNTILPIKPLELPEAEPEEKDEMFNLLEE